jgi:type I restriction enzyme S subunit
MSDFTALGQHITVRKGKPPLATPYFGDSAEIYLSPEYLRNNADGISAKPGNDAVRARNGDTILLWDGSNAGECFKAKTGLVASTMARIDHTNQFQPAFMFHLLKHAEQILRNQTNGTGIPHIDKGILESIQVFKPNVHVQTWIAEVLDILDDLINQTTVVVEKLRQVKQGLLHDLLTRGINANGELRPRYEDAPHLYQKSAMGWIPKQWKTVGLIELTPRTRSVIRTGPFGSSLKGEHWRETGRPVVTIGSLGINWFIEAELLYIDEPTARSLSDFELVDGDIVFSRVADVGRSVVVAAQQRGWIMSSNFMRISVDEKKMSPHLIQLLLANGESVRKQMRATVNSGGRDVANSAILMGLWFPLPPIAEQHQIIAQVAAADLRLNEEIYELGKLSSVKLALMDDLLTGRVRVTPLLTKGDLT